MQEATLVHAGKIEDCPQCGQRVRIPENVGGVSMACPACGHSFFSHFRVGNDSAPKRTQAPLGPPLATPAPAEVVSAQPVTATAQRHAHLQARGKLNIRV